MISIPSFLLKRLYVKGSLRRSESTGFEFQLKNDLGSGYAYKIWPIKIDDVELTEVGAQFITDGKVTKFSEVSKNNTLTLGLNKIITVQIPEFDLNLGPHKIGMGFDVPGIGTLRFDFTDEPQG